MPPKRKAKGSGNTKPAKRPAARKDLLHDERHIFSAKSKLVKEDLTAFFANPATWDALTDEEKDTIRGLLPDDMLYTDEGAPSQEFLRYGNDWRNGVRLFGEDVQAGRYEPEWLEEAHEASRLRRSGAFDDWKEQQFEEFWGQKSDAHADLLAGKAINIRLPEMVAAGLFRLGDVFTYTRGFGNGKNGFVVEKNSTISKITGKKITFTMAPGRNRVPQQKSLGSSKRPSHLPLRDSVSSGADLPAADQTSADPSSANGTAPSPTIEPTSHKDEISLDPSVAAPLIAGHTESSSLIIPESAPSQDPITDPDIDGDSVHDAQQPAILPSTQGQTSSPSEKIAHTSPGAAKEQSAQSIQVVAPAYHEPEKFEDGSDSSLSSVDDANSDLSDFEMGVEDGGPGSPSHSDVRDTSNESRSDTSSADIVTFKGIDSLQTLEDKILEVDGRVKYEPRRTAWRIFRCVRGKKDLGTLGDMRESYYKQKYG